MLNDERDLNFLRRIFLYVVDRLVGDGGFQIAVALLNQGGLTDEQLSEITGLSITAVRNILITLQNLGLLSLIKEKQKNTGWINYYWYAEPLSVKRFFKEQLRRSIIHLREYIKELKEGNIFYCQECGIKYIRDEAERNEFVCKVCGGELAPYEASKNLDNIVSELIEKYRSII